MHHYQLGWVFCLGIVTKGLNRDEIVTEFVYNIKKDSYWIKNFLAANFDCTKTHKNSSGHRQLGLGT